MTDSSYMIAPGTTAEEMATKRRIAMALMQQGMNGEPIQHWTQGAAKMLQSALGGYELHRADKEDKEETAASNAALMDAYDRSTGGQGGTPAPSPVVGALGDTSQPRGIRNNNPLNIEAGGFTQGQPGFSGSDGRFARFETPEQGVGAANKLLDVYQNKHGLNTVAGIVGRWAPSSDGNNVSAYAANVSKQLGIDPNTPIPPEMRPKLIAAMGQHENGRPIGNVAAALGGPQGDPAALPPNSTPAGPQPMQMAQASPQGQPNREMLIKMLSNSRTAPMARQIISSQIGQQFKPQDYDIHHRADGTIVATGKKNPQDVRIVQQPGASQSIINHKAAEAAAVKKAGEVAEGQGKATVALPAALTAAQDALGVIQKTRNHPGIDRSTGALGAVWSSPGSKAKDFDVLVTQLKGKAFKEAFESLKGGGAISEKEGEAATAAIARLDQSQSKQAFLEALADLEKIINLGISNAQTRAGNVPTQQRNAPATPQASKTINGKNYIKIDGQWFEE
jgi:hypothetical protein